MIAGQPLDHPCYLGRTLPGARVALQQCPIFPAGKSHLHLNQFSGNAHLHKIIYTPGFLSSWPKASTVCPSTPGAPLLVLRLCKRSPGCSTGILCLLDYTISSSLHLISLCFLSPLQLRGSLFPRPGSVSSSMAILLPGDPVLYLSGRYVQQVCHRRA